MTDHFDQKPRRQAEYIKPPNLLKNKVGSGGLSEELLARAQEMLDENTVDFEPLAETYLNTLNISTAKAQSYIDLDGDHEEAIVGMLYPAMQLKANGGMFRYPLVTLMSDKLVQFLEVIAKIDPEVIELVLAYITAIRAMLASKITAANMPQGQSLVLAFDDACHRYFKKHPDNCNPL